MRCTRTAITLRSIAAGELGRYAIKINHLDVLTTYIQSSIVSSMDKTYQLNGINFVWDTNKAQLNENSHGVTFEQAAEAFFDPFLRIVDASPEQETRDAVIGMDVHWHLLFVVHIFIEDEQIRLISARKATRTEKQYYEN
jgi:uncharacterized DUF497 family protein